MPQYLDFHLFGNKIIKIPIKDDGDNEGGAFVTTPEWMLKVDDVLSSQIQDFTDYCPLYGHSFELARLENNDVTTKLFNSATIRHSDLNTVIPNGEFAPVLENMLHIGKVIKELKIIRLSNIESSRFVRQTITLTGGKITRFVHQSAKDQVMVVFSGFETRTNHIVPIGLNGTPQGNVVSEVNYAQNTNTIDKEGGGNDDGGDE